LLVSAALHAAAAVFHALLHRATRRPEHRAFARFAGSLCVYIVANAVTLAYPETSSALIAAAFVWLGGGLAATALVELIVALTAPSPPTKELWALYGVNVLLALTTISSSLILDPHPEQALRHFPEQPIAAGLMAFHSVVAFSMLAWALVRLARAARGRRDLRLLMLGIGTSVLVSALDEVVRWVTGSRPHLSEHAGILPVVVMTMALAGRQVRFASDLAQKGRDLAQAQALLAETQDQRGRQEPLAALGELSAVVAHEVRNPLAIVKNAVSSLRRPALAPEDRATLLEIVGEEAGRLSRLVRDLLAFARPRAAAESEVVISTLVHRAVRDATRSTAELISRIEVELEGPTQLLGDPELLRLALANLVENALHATEEGGKVRILTRVTKLGQDDAVALIVEDDGPGMSPEVAQKARDPFFTTRATGTGLGLAIVERVMRSHAGDLAISTESGRGSRVILTVPLAVPRSLTLGVAP
jgi:signal transduction histidine kinase